MGTIFLVFVILALGYLLYPRLLEYNTIDLHYCYYYKRIYKLQSQSLIASRRAWLGVSSKWLSCKLVIGEVS